MTPPTLPQELVEWIIDYLHNDYPSLKACCLTCRAFVEASRYHLFQSIKLQYMFQPRKFLEAIKNCPKIPTYVHRIRLLIPLQYLKGYGHENITNSPLPEDIVSHLISLLPNVETLILVSFEIIRPSMHPIFMERLQPLSRTLKCLNLQKAKFFDPRSLIDLVSSFPVLERLVLTPDFLTNHKPGRMFPSTPSSLRSLDISLNKASVLLPKWIQSFVVQLRYLKVTCFSSAVTKEICPLLEIVGKKVTHLHLCLTRWTDNPFRSAARLECLRQLSLRISLTFNDEADANDWIHLVLANIRSPYLRAVNFEVILHSSVNAGEKLRNFDWGKLEDLLLDSSFISVGVVEFSIRFHSQYIQEMPSFVGRHDESAVEMLRAQLQRLEGSKNLRFFIRCGDQVVRQ